jgi:hypothetical protein
LCACGTDFRLLLFCSHCPQLLDASNKYSSEVQLLAATVIDVGMEVLYSTADLRADLLSSLLARHATSTLSHAESKLLTRCLKRFTTPAGVTSLIPKPGPDRKDNVGARARVVRLLADMLDVLSKASASTSAGAGAGATGSAASGEDATTAAVSGVVAAVTELLVVFHSHLFSLIFDWSDNKLATVDPELIAGKDSTPEDFACVSPMWDLRLGGFGWATSCESHPAIPLAFEYGRVLLRRCASVLEDAVHSVQALQSSSSSSKAAARRAVASLESSIVYSLLPSFAGFACLLSSDPWVAATLLPSFTAVCVRLEQFDSAVLRVIGEAGAAVSIPLPAVTEDKDKQKAKVGWHAAGPTGVCLGAVCMCDARVRSFL